MCNNSGKAGHIAAKCYLKHKRETRVNKPGAETQGRVQKFQGNKKGEFKCYNCGETGHMARQCKNHRQVGKNALIAEAGSGVRPPDNENPRIGSVNTLGSGNGTTLSANVCKQILVVGRNYYYYW
jgi:hypothetical protein